MALRRLRKHCAALVADLDIPLPFSVQELCRRLARTRGRPIRLAPIALPTGAPCGVWLSVNGTDYVLYEQHTSPLHQQHIILHEIGHLLCEHEAGPILEAETAAVLLPHLDPRMVAGVLGRTSYSAVEEQQAELIASLILQEANAWSPEPQGTAGSAAGPAETAVVGRLEAALAAPPRRRCRG